MRVYRSIQPLFNQFHQACTQANSAVFTFGHADGYPLLGSWTGKEGPALLIASGIHGDEPAGPWGLLGALPQLAHSPLRILWIPMLNPWGYERYTRYLSTGHDLNRLWDSPQIPQVGALHRLLENVTLVAGMDLHEDWEFTNFYLYELGYPRMGQEIAASIRPMGHLSHHEKVEPYTTQEGVIAPTLTADQARSQSNLPLALWLYGQGVQKVVTIETPGRLPLSQRIQMQIQATATFCAMLSPDLRHSTCQRAPGSV